MIDKFCDFITKNIKREMPDIDEERQMIIDFGIRLIFGELPKILILFLIGFLLNVGWYTILIFFMLAPYRSFAGGVHLKTHMGCMISTIIIYAFPVILAKYIALPQNYILYILSAVTFIIASILIAKYAPADTENVPILSKKERKSRRIKSYILLIILLIVATLSTDRVISYMLVYGILLQNITMLPIVYKLTNCKHGYEVYGNEAI